MGERHAGPRTLGAVLNQVLAALPQADAAERALVERWPEIVGAEAAAHSAVLSLEGSRLTVAVDPAGRHFEWKMNRERYLARIAGVLGAGAVRELVLTPRKPHGR